MTINGYLNGLATKFVVRDDEKEQIVKSINFIHTKLNRYFNCAFSPFLIGSYPRGTILPRQYDENSDIDLIVPFDNSMDLKPQSFLNKLKNFITASYTRSEIHQSMPTIVLELHHIKFEIIPAYYFNNNLYIPKNPSEWQYTDPQYFNDRLLQINKQNNYKIKPIIRLFKYWNIVKNNRYFTSYELESKLCDAFQYSSFSDESYQSYINTGFNCLIGYMNQQRAKEYYDYINKAYYFDDRYRNDGLEMIKKLFPEP